jgi:hypothetical protein
VRKGQFVGQRIQSEAPDFADFVTVWAWLTSFDIARIHDQDDGLAALRVHPDKTCQSNGNSELLEHFSHCRLFEHFTSVDIPGWKTPQATARIDAAPSKKHSMVVSKNNGYSDFRVEVVNEAARRAGWSIAVLVTARLERRAAHQTVALILVS